ncbi:hypothetical protein AB0X41_08400 [Lapidilactobacillus dextrinicus]
MGIKIVICSSSRWRKVVLEKVVVSVAGNKYLPLERSGHCLKPILQIVFKTSLIVTTKVATIISLLSGI